MKRKKFFKILVLLFAAAVFTAAVWLLAGYTIKHHNFYIFNFEPKQKDTAQILFVGDLMFDRGIRYYAGQNEGNEFIFDKIHKTLTSYDLVVPNLEGPITDNKSKSLGSAIGSENNYYFTFNPSVATTLFNQNIRIVDLGNNHILNFGRNGLAQTKKYLDQAHIGYFGAPDYPKSISKEINGIKIAFVSFNQFSDLSLENEIASTQTEITKAKQYADIVIVFCHWGEEYLTDPTQEQIKIGRQFIDNGADLVIGSHPHVIQPMEEYKGKRIYYSLGNFIFDQYFDENVRKGLGVAVTINKNTKEMTFSEKNFYLDSNGQTVLK